MSVFIARCSFATALITVPFLPVLLTTLTSTPSSIVDMTREALEIMFAHLVPGRALVVIAGVLNANGIAPIFRGPDEAPLKPYQKPHPPIGSRGFISGSETPQAVRRCGFTLPMKFGPHTDTYVRQPWAAVLEGAERAAAERRIAATGPSGPLR